MMEGGPLDAPTLDAHPETLEYAAVLDGDEERVADPDHARDARRSAGIEARAVAARAIAAAEIGGR
ncbi:MAG: hypothetical protein R3F14_09000 [Polyangiaceae bacterium]